MATNTSTITTAEMIEAIMRGDADDNLRAIETSARERAKFIAVTAATLLVKGDKVRLVDISPKYLNGAVATVVRTARTTVITKLEEDTGRFPAGRELTVPATCIEKIEP